MTHPHMTCSGELRDGLRTGLRLARLYAAIATWRSWMTRATPEERAYALGKRDGCYVALRSVEKFHEDAFEAAGGLVPALRPGERVAIIAAIRRVVELRMPETFQAWIRGVAERAEPRQELVEVALPKREKRKRVAYEADVVAVKEAALNAGDRATVRDCNLILRGRSTETAVRAFLEEKLGGDA